MNNIAIDIPLTLKTVTPVAVGGDKGALLSPYADYVFDPDGKRLHYLNLKKVETAVLEAELLDEYIAGIKNSMDNNRSDFDLGRFLTGRLKRDLSYFSAHTVPQKGLSAKDRKHIVPSVKNAGAAYLPGSSVKGALRTAILYDWLVQTKDGEQELNNSAKTLQQLQRVKDDLFRLSKNKNDPKARSDIRELNKRERDLENGIFDEDKLMGSLKSPMGPDARHLRVSDSQPLNGGLAVYALRRIRIEAGKDKSAIPQPMEAIVPGQLLNLNLGIVPNLQHKVLDYWNKGSFEDIFANLKQFSNACIANELIELRDALAADQPSGFEEEVEKLLEFYEILQHRAEEGAVFLRLGFGKTVNDNSLLLALLNGRDTDSDWHTFRSAFHKIRRQSAFFPVTRAITPDGLPMGWVEVTKTT